MPTDNGLEDLYDESRLLRLRSADLRKASERLRTESKREREESRLRRQLTAAVGESMSDGNREKAK